MSLLARFSPLRGLFTASRKLRHVPCRCFYTKIFKKPSPGDFKLSDNIPEDFTLIYRNTMSKYIMGAQLVSLVCGGCILMVILVKGDYSEKETLPFTKSRSSKNEQVFYMTSLVLFVFSLQLMVTRTPIRIYKVPQTDKYISISYGGYVPQTKRVQFGRGQVKRAAGSEMLPWNESRFVLETETDRKVLYLFDQFFRRGADCSIMLGEQKDPDLE